MGAITIQRSDLGEIDLLNRTQIRSNQSDDGLVKFVNPVNQSIAGAADRISEWASCDRIHLINAPVFKEDDFHGHGLVVTIPIQMERQVIGAISVDLFKTPLDQWAAEKQRSVGNVLILALESQW